MSQESSEPPDTTVFAKAENGDGIKPNGVDQSSESGPQGPPEESGNPAHMDAGAETIKEKTVKTPSLEIDPELYAQIAANNKERNAAEANVQELYQRRSQALALFLPLAIFVLAILAAYERKLFFFISENSTLHIEYAFVRILILWLFVIAVFVPAYYFLYQTNINQAEHELREIEEAVEVDRLATVPGRIASYRERLFRLSARTAKTAFFDADRTEQAARLRKQAGNVLDTVSVSVSTTGLSEIESCLNALDGLINLEEREQKEQRYWQYAALLVMFIYIAGLVIVIVRTDAAKSNAPTPILGVPISVVVWGAAGSLAAILYRFYTEQGRIRFASEFRWLIARPIIGIIMGAVVYLALISGLVMLGTVSNTSTPPTEGALQVGRMEVYWVIAFLAGFSDKFYLGVIDLLVARTVRSEEVKQNKIITEKERIPETHKAEGAEA